MQQSPVQMETKASPTKIEDSSMKLLQQLVENVQGGLAQMNQNARTFASKYPIAYITIATLDPLELGWLIIEGPNFNGDMFAYLPNTQERAQLIKQVDEIRKEVNKWKEYENKGTTLRDIAQSGGGSNMIIPGSYAQTIFTSQLPQDEMQMLMYLISNYNRSAEQVGRAMKLLLDLPVKPLAVQSIAPMASPPTITTKLV